MHKQKVTPYTN